MAVELHFRLWDPGTEHIAVAGLESFWGRRKRSRIEDFCFPALDPADRLAYAALHLFRHLLRGDVRLYHVYELAHFLDATADDLAFWQGWQNTHGESLRAIEAISFRLASHWFGCRIAPEVQTEFDHLAEPIQRWFQVFGTASLESKTHPNKNELWLHLSLVESSAGKRAVMLRRLFPVRRHKTMHAPHVPESQTTWRLRIARQTYRARFSLARLVHHLRSAPSTAFGGLRWWWAGKEIKPQFLRFLAAASLFNFGMSIFFLLYNLLLLQRGFQEDFVGSVSSAMSIGSLTGTVPAAFVLHRFGLRNSLVGAFSGLGVVCVIRAIAAAPFVLIASAFLGGFVFSLYAVSIAPTVAELTTRRARPFGFSLVFSLGIAIGVLAGVAGGRLPALLAGGSAPGILPLQNALLVACAIAAMGALPAHGLHFRTNPKSERRVYPRTPFIKQFLVALLLWSLATGALNPFFAVYFSKSLAMPIGQIGTLFSVAQLVQVLALIMAPLVLRRLGMINGLMTMQIATAVALAALAAGPTALVAGAVYATYMAFQYMSEPGMYSLLMERVKP
jgi:MFS family permease